MGMSMPCGGPTSAMNLLFRESVQLPTRVYQTRKSWDETLAIKCARIPA